MPVNGPAETLRNLSRNSAQSSEIGRKAVRSMSRYIGTIWYIPWLNVFGGRIYGASAIDPQYAPRVSHPFGRGFFLGSTHVHASNKCEYFTVK